MAASRDARLTFELANLAAIADQAVPSSGNEHGARRQGTVVPDAGGVELPRLNRLNLTLLLIERAYLPT